MQASLQERRPRPVVEVREVTRRFRGRAALDGVSLEIGAGRIHALLGPNGAGKTTLLRILAGLTAPHEGSVLILSLDPSRNERSLREQVGLVPSGDRSFYLRLSGLENLAFFGRLNGLRRRQAFSRARELLADVGLERAARVPVGEYSHGMQKRLSVARALLGRPSVLLVDEATHDLDPQGARDVQALVESVSVQGAAVLWATQRLDEIRGFAHGVTVLDGGRTQFTGSVGELLRTAPLRRYVVRLHGVAGSRAVLGDALPGGRLFAAGGDDYVLELSPGTVLGDVLRALLDEGVAVLDCREERSGLEQAFLHLVETER